MTLAPLLTASPAIQIHVVSALTAFVLGAAILFRRKGGWRHRLGGRAWVVLLLIVAVSSFFIHEIRLWGDWSPIHLLSVLVIVSLASAVWAIRGGDVARHRWVMKSTYVGGLVIAGLFTFAPGRIMFEVLFGGS